ncbi:AraC family transcriptional regulator [Microbacterium maritypicum]|uniref:helix-turn-helix domain-containing protein n=1 Tax=Microbacterium maritypicum TaxID=33918 RepID=UPI001B332FD3|nr:helix-turn-helix domain-containing protein [Microbacterium liquefaciens]MBP5802242.1 AraC family transcriptional regulator [Microbacterium liquefaciens]
MESTERVALREQCFALIEAHFRRPEVSPVWLAQELYVSRRQLDRAFAGGPGVAETLGRRRLKQVVIMAARNPTVAMSVIAVHCGYGTYETFRSQCHRYLHMTPRQARRDLNVTLAA